MRDWLRRNVLVLRNEDPDWPTLSVLAGDWLELWRAGHRRGLLLRFSRFQVSACRRYVYVALTDHKRYIDIIFARPRGFDPTGE